MSSSTPESVVHGTMPDVHGMTIAHAEEAINAASEGGNPTYQTEQSGSYVLRTRPAKDQTFSDVVTLILYTPEP